MISTLFYILLFTSVIKLSIAKETKTSEVATTQEPVSVQLQVPTFQIPDEEWTSATLKDIAYFLRNYKFNEWDRRYYDTKPERKLIGFFSLFPNPPLKALHWNIDENCKKNFFKCITYLRSVIETSPLNRNDDTSVQANENTLTNKSSLVELDLDCRKALQSSEKNNLPFDSSFEKFQWRTSAAYYMCWYTMLGIPSLSMLGESCDNFASCLDPQYGSKNRDPRSDDRLSFACAMYSFCPDPCCPLKHVTELNQCYDSILNPCYKEFTSGISDKYCKFDRKLNQNFDGIINNKWNVTCKCTQSGFTWSSEFEMCVDKNECKLKKHSCNLDTEECLNLPGTFYCICKWGYTLDKISKKCVKNIALTNNWA